MAKKVEGYIKLQIPAGKATVGVVQKLDYGKQTATINVEMFGRETPVEISFAEVRKL